MSARPYLSLLCAAAVLSMAALASPASAMSRSLDPDSDGTLDLPEALAAGRNVFARLDPDKDRTLDARELSGRVNAAALKASDPDSDNTLDLNEYLALIKERFGMANPDDDQVIDSKELKTPHGRALLALIQ